LQPRPYDEAIVLPNTFKSALIRFSRAFPFARDCRELRYGLLTGCTGSMKTRCRSWRKRYAQLAEEPRSPPSRPLAEVRLRVDQANLAAALERLELSRSKPWSRSAPARVRPGQTLARAPLRDLAKTLAARGRAVWLFGSGKDREIGEEIVRLARAPRSTCAARPTRERDRPALARRGRSQQRFRADARRGGRRRPVVALYGSSSPEHTPPWAHLPHRQNGIDLQPCYARSVRSGISSA